MIIGVSRRLKPVLVSLVSIATLGGCSRTSHPEAVFLIVVDTLRPDRLSCYGFEGHATPNIDRLASMGILFSQTHSVASWTVPSMGSILTSLYPTQIGLTEQPSDGKSFDWRARRPQLNGTLSQDERTLAEVLQGAGFRTAGFVNQPGLTTRDGFVQGFRDWYYPVSADEIVLYEPAKPLQYRSWAPFVLESYRIDMGLIDEFDTWLASNSQEKPFAWIHLLTPHLPYNPAQEFRSARTPPDKTSTTRQTPDQIARDPVHLDRISKLYDAEVVAADHMVGKILDAIDEHVGFERSLIIFTSDHGEEFGEHGMVEHGHTLHREVVHVPLIVASPSLRGGRTVDAVVRTIDIFPTILETLGEDELAPAGLEGSSLVPCVSDNGSDRPVFSEAMLYGSTERSLLAGGYKLIYDEQDDSYRLFDVSEDPGESVDISEREPERLTQLRTAMTEVYEQLLTDRLARTGEAPRRAEEDEATLKALRALGYIH